ncbi:hypothetical protein QQF64_006163 [Cirrhinus molitorella]|uniref:Dual specificity phosphatase catalytic domain-containing protein n=1 Tax=Cirrhinus molitorella TaxID=172907 RepID=A0ABR3MHG0_9TELE
MGITHILNAAAVKKKLRVLMGMRNEKDLKGNINTGPKYYKGMNIKYCGLPTTHKDGVKMGMYFSTAAKFINKALRNTENKVLVHCCDGVSHSPMLLLAYRIIHRDMNVEECGLPRPAPSAGLERISSQLPEPDVVFTSWRRICSS